METEIYEVRDFGAKTRKKVLATQFIMLRKIDPVSATSVQKPSHDISGGTKAGKQGFSRTTLTPTGIAPSF